MTTGLSEQGSRHCLLQKVKNNEFLFTKMTSDVEQAWAHPSLFPDPVIYSANLTETKVLKAVMESYLN